MIPPRVVVLDEVLAKWIGRSYVPDRWGQMPQTFIDQINADLRPLGYCVDAASAKKGWLRVISLGEAGGAA